MLTKASNQDFLVTRFVGLTLGGGFEEIVLLKVTLF